jgi:DNA-binding LacI/PurR family transcriptional regulator
MLSRKRPPQAIFAASDNITLGVVNAAGSMQLRIPEDLTLVGFDDTDFSSYPGIELTTVSQSKYEMGSLSAHMLIDLIDRKESQYSN